MGRPIFLLALAVLAACGGKLAPVPEEREPRKIDTDYVPAPTPRPTTTIITPAPPSVTFDAGPPSVETELTTSSLHVVAFSGAKSGLGLELDTLAVLDNGRLTHVDPLGPILEPANTSRSFAWGYLPVDGADTFYALGHGLLVSFKELALTEAHFQRDNGEGGGASHGQSRISAFCSLASNVCKISIEVDDFPNPTLQFVPSAQIKGTRIIGDALAGKSRLRAAFTCSADCSVGRLSGFGIVLAYEIENPNGPMLRGAEALPYRDPK